jgi:hypothetical protein
MNFFNREEPEISELKLIEKACSILFFDKREFGKKHIVNSCVSLVKRIVTCHCEINANYMLTDALAVDCYSASRTGMDVDVVTRLNEENVPSIANSAWKETKVDIIEFQKAIEKDQASAS